MPFFDVSSISAFTIIFREGLESILLISAIVLMLKHLKLQHLNPVVWCGAISGLAASFVLFFASYFFLSFGSTDKEIVEGVTMLITAPILFYLSYWLISKTHAEKWQQFIKKKVSIALTKSNQMALAFLAFVSVFREGFETTLMLRALEASGATWTSIAFGTAVGSIVLLVLFVVIMYTGAKVPIKLFFTATSIFLLTLAISFVGHGIWELQEAGVLTLHSTNGIPFVSSVVAFFGLRSSLEATGAQFLVTIFALSGLTWFFYKTRSTHIIKQFYTAKEYNKVVSERQELIDTLKEVRQLQLPNQKTFSLADDKIREYTKDG